MSANKKIYSKEELLQYAYNSLPAVLFAKDLDCRYVYCSAIKENAFTNNDSILNKRDTELFYPFSIGEEYYNQDIQILATGELISCISELPVEDKKRSFKISKGPVYDNTNNIIGVAGIVSEVTELVELKEKYEKLSMVDSLTGAYNRNFIEKHDYNDEKYLPCSYIMCDCDDLKVINDTYGHDVGDGFIRTVSNVLSFVMPNRAATIRWGGDEFLVIIPNCDSRYASKLTELVIDEIIITKQTIPYVDVSIGYATKTSLDENTQDIIEQADNKMFDFKRQKKGANNQ